jgi:hypothetical protein
VVMVFSLGFSTMGLRVSVFLRSEFCLSASLSGFFEFTCHIHIEAGYLDGSLPTLYLLYTIYHYIYRCRMQ